MPGKKVLEREAVVKCTNDVERPGNTGTVRVVFGSGRMDVVGEFWWCGGKVSLFEMGSKKV